MSAGTVILGWGNPSRGDDALGPLLCRRLEAWLPAQAFAAEVEVCEDFQLQIEHALDLVGRQRILFVDAVAGPAQEASDGFEFRSVSACRDASHTSHALTPEAVLAVFEQLQGQPAPPAFVLGVRGHSFELGADLSAAAAANLEAAWDFVQSLCRAADVRAWQRRAAGNQR